MKKIYIVRHGETTWNLEGRTQGQKDSHLTELGLFQASQLGKYLAKEPIEVMYSSNLDRARSTALIIGKETGLDCHFHEGLAEICFGLWEGLTVDDIAASYPKELDIWHTTPHLSCIPEGEGLKLAQERICAAVDEIIKATGDKNVLIVSHGTVIKLYLQAFLNMDLSAFYKLKQRNCALNIIAYKKRSPMLVKYNDTSFMDIMIEGGTIEKS